MLVNWHKPGRWRARFMSYDDTYSEPTGCEPPYSWLIANKGGGLSAFGEISGGGTINSAALAQGINVESDLTGSGTIDSASLALVVSLAAEISGSGDITPPVLQMILGMAAALSGDGDISDASLSLIVQMQSDLAGTGTISEATMVGLANMSANIVVDEATGITVADIWNKELEGGYTMEEAMKIILSALAGKVSGAGTTTITFRNVPDTKDRIVATVDSNGNRSSVTLDVGD